MGKTMLRGALALATSAWIGCSNAADDQGGDGGSGGTSATATSNDASVSSSSASASGAGGADGSGGRGGSGGSGGRGGAGVDGPGCDAPAAAPSDGSCVTLTTGAGGSGDAAIECNPVTNAPCRADEACDGSANGFICYPAGNTESLCEPCNPGAMEFCKGTMTCDTSTPTPTCIRYCCNDADCGTGTCTKEELGEPVFQYAPDLGVCLVS